MTVRLTGVCMEIGILFFALIAAITKIPLPHKLHFDKAAADRRRVLEVKGSRATLITCALLLLSACTQSNASGELDSSNLLQFTTVTQSDDRFFAPLQTLEFAACVDARVVPDPRPSKCTGRFANGHELDIHRLSISIAAHATPYANTKVEELALMVASKVALDHDYPYMIKLAEIENGGCTSNPSIYSSGTLQGNFYSGQSTITDNPVCSTLYTIDVLFFKNYDDIKSGVVLSIRGTNSSTWFADLYYNMLDRYSDISSEDLSRRAYFQHHPLNPWKHYLPTRDVFESLAKKYGIPDSIIIPVSQINRTSTPRSIEDQLTIHAK